jgi:3D (Asp-Asp-Asp) domain-containing protein
VTLKQLLLITAVVLLLVLRTASTLTAQVREARQEAQQEIQQAKEDAIEAREFALESEKYETQLMNITMYAPLSPDAVPGWDYKGDPSLTASGERLVPGETAAAGENIPFGTRIYVEGLGWHTVHDRGRLIGPNDIDLAVPTREESIEFGKQQRLVIIHLPETEDEKD